MACRTIPMPPPCLGSTHVENVRLVVLADGTKDSPGPAACTCVWGRERGEGRATHRHKYDYPPVSFCQVPPWPRVHRGAISREPKLLPRCAHRGSELPIVGRACAASTPRALRAPSPSPSGRTAVRPGRRRRYMPPSPVGCTPQVQHASRRAITKNK